MGIAGIAVGAAMVIEYLVVFILSNICRQSVWIEFEGWVKTNLRVYDI
jgi:hypothetical protein